MFLQAILGAWPLELLTENPDPKAIEEFRRRLGAYAEKAMREGKRRSSWVNVDEAYEGAVAKLFDALVAPGSDFLRQVRPFAARLARVGMVTGLARSALKCTLPGLPDIYQGTEFWDFSFVDPDNRRPVDYAEREAALGQDVALEDLLASWPDGRIKQRVLARLLADRAAFPASTPRPITRRWRPTGRGPTASSPSCARTRPPVRRPATCWWRCPAAWRSRTARISPAPSPARACRCPRAASGATW